MDMRAKGQTDGRVDERTDIQADRQRARVALQTVRLDHLVPALEDEQVRSWDVILSPGERQRLEITRALLRRPRLLFLDEATALVDEATEALIYEALVGASEAMISVAHRGTVRCFHTRELHFSGDEDKGWTEHKQSEQRTDRGRKQQKHKEPTKERREETEKNIAINGVSRN